MGSIEGFRTSSINLVTDGVQNSLDHVDGVIRKGLTLVKLSSRER